MATHVGIIHKGKLLFQGSLKQLQQLQSKQSAVEIEVNDIVRAQQVLQEQFPVKQVNGSLLLVNYESRERSALLNKLLVQEGVEVYQMAVKQNDLENLFIQITAQ